MSRTLPASAWTGMFGVTMQWRPSSENTLYSGRCVVSSSNMISRCHVRNDARLSVTVHLLVHYRCIMTVKRDKDTFSSISWTSFRTFPSWTLAQVRNRCIWGRSYVTEPFFCSVHLFNYWPVRLLNILFAGQKMVEWNQLDVASFLEQASSFLAEHGQLDGPSCHAPPAKRARSVGLSSHVSALVLFLF